MPSLTLSRRIGEEIITTGQARFEIVRIKGGRVWLSFKTDGQYAETGIWRAELTKENDHERQAVKGSNNEPQ